jgi:Tol biopolymer transport system component
MDSAQKTFATQSLISFKKSFVLLALLSVFGCSSSKKQKEIDFTAKPVMKPVETELGLQLTQVGQNAWPRISTDNQYVLFVSSERYNHTQPQLYELSLSEQKERRITYQDGEVQDPLWSKDFKKVFYGSTTDELKEKPTLLYKSESPFPPTELYESDRVGNDIERVTKQEGYQGMFSWSIERRPKIIFSSYADGRLYVETVDDRGHKSVIEKDPEISFYYPQLKNSLLVAVGKKTKEALGKIYFGKLRTPLTPFSLPEAEYRDLSWVSADTDQILFSSNWKDKSSFSLYILDLKKMCVIELLKTKYNLLQASVSPDGKKIIFISDMSGKKQIYLRDFHPTGLSCDPI